MTEDELFSLLGYPGGLFYVGPKSFDSSADLNQWLGLGRIGSTEPAPDQEFADFAAEDTRPDFAALVSQGNPDFAAKNTRPDFAALVSEGGADFAAVDRRADFAADDSQTRQEL